MTEREKKGFGSQEIDNQVEKNTVTVDPLTTVAIVFAILLIPLLIAGFFLQ